MDLRTMLIAGLLAIMQFNSLGHASTSAFAAARDGSTEELDAILADEPDSVQRVDEYGQTLLMYAAEFNSADMVDFLLLAGADVNVRSSAGWTPLMYAARGGNEEIAAILLEARAIPDTRNQDDMTAEQISLAHGHDGIAQLLRDFEPEQLLNLSKGDRVVVADGPLNVRKQPKLQAETVGAEPTGAEGTIFETEPVYADSHWWWHILYDDGLQGWSAEGTGGTPFLDTLPAPVVTRPATVPEAVPSSPAATRSGPTTKQETPPETSEQTRSVPQTREEAQQPERRGSGRVRAVRRARNELGAYYYNLGLGFLYEERFLSGRGRQPAIHLYVTVPAKFPTPEFKTDTTLWCGEGLWAENEEFDLFLRISGAERAERSFTLGDIRVSCTENGEMTIQSDDMYRTFALLDVTIYTQAHTGGSPETLVADDYLEFGLERWGSLILNNPAYDIDPAGWCCKARLRLWDNDTVTVRSEYLDTAGVNAGEALEPILFQNRHSTPIFDSAGINHIYLNLEGGATWDNITLNFPEASLTWSRSTEIPE